MSLSIVILAAGRGRRMHSDIAKVLHPLAGKPLLEHVTDTIHGMVPKNQLFIIYGYLGEQLKTRLSHLPTTWVEQKEQRGTGHAVEQALNLISDDDQVLILYGDVPLISKKTITNLIEATPKNSIGLITAHLKDCTGLGRIIRNQNNEIIRIVEDKDANANEKQISEINTGIYFIPAKLLKKWLPELKNSNAQKEYYLTDVIQFAVDENISIVSIEPEIIEEITGVNDQYQLANLERFFQQQQAYQLMLQGVTLMDPARFDLRGHLIAGKDVSIDINVIIEGNVALGNHCKIGPNVFLKNCKIGSYSEIKANSVLEGAEISDYCIIGPFARLRPGTILANHTHIGNFVEIKNSFIDTGSKVNHLSYIGDCEMGKKVNIGAGTITCNYDGMNKHHTTIGDNVFVGSCTQLVAPIKIGDNATIGAGSTITHNAPADKLTLARAKQVTIEGWERGKVKEE